jgi:6-phosphogluconolactonase (cycloisomerase 2 family)
VDILTGITLSAPSNTLPFGAGQTYAAIGSFTLADESTVTQDISSQVTWNSSNPNVAAIDTSGNVTTGATGQTQGTTTITATSCDGFTVGSALLTVGASGPVSLQIMPANPTVAAGSTVTFTAVEVLSGGGTQPVTGTLSWSSDTTSVATINMTSGLAITVPGAGGTANISATETPAGSSNMISGTTVLTTTAAAARFAYVGNGSGLEGAGSISAYTVNAAAGSLTPFDSEFPASSPQQVLLHPSGHLMYYIDAASFLHVLDVDSVAGGLTDPGLAPRQAGSGGANVGVIDPTGRFIYVVDDGSNSGTPSIYGYSITQTTSSATNGTLAAIPGATPHTDSNLSSPSWVMTDNAGKYLYVVNSGSNWITEYSIDQTSGALTALPTPYIVTGNAPLFGTTDINGFLYVANNGTVQSVSAYSITPSTGQLVSAGADTVVTGATSTINVLAHPSGNFLYVVDQNSNALQPGQVFAFGLSPTTPTSVIGAVIPPGSSATTGYPTGLSPLGLAIDPTGIFMVVANNGDTPNDLSLIKIGADGSLAAPSGATTAPADSNAQFPVFYNFASGQ